MQKWRWKTWFILSHEWCQCLRTSVDRGGKGFPLKNEVEAWSYNFCPKHWSFDCSQCKKHTALGSKWRMHAWNVSFQSGTTPCFVYLGRHWRHSRDKMDQAFPLHFYVLQVFKNWTVGRPGNKTAMCPLWCEYIKILWRKGLCRIKFTYSLKLGQHCNILQLDFLVLCIKKLHQIIFDPRCTCTTKVTVVVLCVCVCVFSLFCLLTLLGVHREVSVATVWEM